MKFALALPLTKKNRENFLPFTFSFMLHCFILGTLFFYTHTPKTTTSIPPTTLLLLSNLPVHNHTPQEENQKKANVTPALAKIKTELPLKTTKSIDTNGRDSESTKEIRSSGNAGIEAVTYAQELQSFIEKNRFYPRRAMILEQTGTVKIRLQINPDGRFSQIEVIEPSQFQSLNHAAKDLLSNLKSFKPLPKSFNGNGEFIVPIYYQIDKRKI